MRPAKRIIVHSPIEAERSLVAFLLRTRLVATIVETDSAVSVMRKLRDGYDAQLDENAYRCVVVIHEGRTASAKAATDALLDSIDLGHPTVPVLLLDLPSLYDESALADRVLHGVYDAALVIEAVRDVWTRKRGPKPPVFQKSNAGRPESEDAGHVERLMSLATGSSLSTVGVSL